MTPLLIASWLLTPCALRAQQPTSGAALTNQNSQFVQGRTWADLQTTSGNPLLAPAAPTVTSVSGGALTQRQYYVYVTYTNLAGETLVSFYSQIVVPASNLLRVTSPATSGNASGWNVYASTVAGSETKQNGGTPIAIATPWTEPTGGLISGAAPPALNTSGLYVNVAAGTVQLANAIFNFAANTQAAVAASTTTYFFFTSAGLLSNNTTGYPAGSVPLSKVVSTTTSTLVTDTRTFLSSTGPTYQALNYLATAGAGLTLNVAAGNAWCGVPPSNVSYSAGTLTMADNATNWVYLDPTASCAPASSTATNMSVGQIPIAKVVTAAGAITTVTDIRTWFAPPACNMNSSGATTCDSLGTNQNLTLSPSGTGWIVSTAATRGTLFGVCVPTPNGVLDVSCMNGADAGAKIIACLAAASAGGATCDSRTVSGAINSTVIISAVNVKLILAGTYTCNVNPCVSVTAAGQVSIWGEAGGIAGAVLIDAVAGSAGQAPMVKVVNSYGFHMTNVGVSGGSLTTTGNMISVYNTGSTVDGGYYFDRVYLSNFSGNGANYAGVAEGTAAGLYLHQVNDVFFFNSQIAPTNATGNSRGIMLDNSGSPASGDNVVHIHDSVFESVNGDAISDVLGASMYQLHVDHNLFENVTGWAFHTVGALESGSFNRNHVEEVSLGALSVAYFSNAMEALGNYVNNDTGTGTQVAFTLAGTFLTNGCHISDNLIFYTTASVTVPVAIVAACRGAVVTGNSLAITQGTSTVTTFVQFPANTVTGTAFANYLDLADNAGTLTNYISDVAANLLVTTPDFYSQSAFRGPSIKVNQIVGALNAVTFSATPTFDASLGNTQTITLTGNVTSSTLSNCAAGEWLKFDIIQDATGGRTFVWPANVLNAGTIGSTLSKHNIQSFYCDGTNARATAAMLTNQN